MKRVDTIESLYQESINKMQKNLKEKEEVEEASLMKEDTEMADK